MKSCLGKILRVDLTTGEIRVERIPESVYDAVLSGKGLGAWYLNKNIPGGAAPLGP
jgi:aldehyde:ferredoxin oxidoreductase